MIAPISLLVPRPEGLYCPPGDFYIDPVRAVARAVITHGHSDHARAGHGLVLATAPTLGFMAARYGERFAGQATALAYGETVSRDGVEVSLAPAGHVLGSAQAVVRWRGLTMVVSGDYKRAADPTCAPFEPVPCDVFVTEATFALPVFRFPDARGEIDRLLASVAQFPGRCHLVGAYSLGKAQRLIALLRAAGWAAPVHVHAAMEAINRVYERAGINLGPLVPIAAADPRALAGAIIIAPPGGGPWARDLPEPVEAFASGWMRIRSRARAQGGELPLILSDHADWDELTATLAELRPGEVWITHGREDALGRWCGLNGLSARALSLVGRGGEGD